MRKPPGRTPAVAGRRGRPYCRPVGDQTSIHVARAIGGDHDSIAWLIGHFRGLVEAQIRIRLRGHGNPQDVEDLAADVWVIVVQRLPELVPREERHAPVLVRFLGTTVLGVCNNFLRRRARTAVHLAPAGPAVGRSEDPLAALPAATRNVVSRVLQREHSDLVAECLDQLAPDQRDVLVLRLMEHRSNVEIGALLGLPPNTIAVRYRRALEVLRQRLPRALRAELVASRQAAGVGE